MKEAIVLDTPKVNIRFKQTKVIHSLSISNFSLLEIIDQENYKAQQMISTENMVVRKINYNRLSAEAKKELPIAIEKIVIKNEQKFVNFFNNARPIGLRRHQLDLLPMIGIKHRMSIIEYIKKEKFKSFKDIHSIEMMPDPVKIIVNRIVDELMAGPEIKYNLFTIPYNIKK